MTTKQFKYKFKRHREIPNYIRDYILSMSPYVITSILSLSLKDINDFMNGKILWEREENCFRRVKEIAKNYKSKFFYSNLKKDTT
jgi:hypothetical protein